MKAITSADKRVVGGQSDINQLAPFKYPWAYKAAITSINNSWTPFEISMAQDLVQYNTKLTDVDKHVYENVLAFLTTADIAAVRNVGLAIMDYITAPEIQLYLARHISEESIHVVTYQHCIETLGLDQGEFYNRYRTVSPISNKIQIANRYLADVTNSNLDMTNAKDIQKFLTSYFFFAGIFEGLWFAHGFTPIFALGRRNLMTATCEQLQYILRDEASLHTPMGLKIINTIMDETGVVLDGAVIHQMMAECHAAEKAYIEYILRDPIIGYSVELHMQHYEYLANRRLKAVGIPALYPDATCVLPWLDEMTGGTKKEKNFFETRVTEYQVGGLSWGESTGDTLYGFKE